MSTGPGTNPPTASNGPAAATVGASANGSPPPAGEAKRAKGAPKQPRPVLDLACQLWFGSWVAVLVLVIRFALGLIHSLPFITKQKAHRLSGKLCGYFFRLNLSVCPWIRIRYYGPTSAIGEKQAMAPMTLRQAISAAGGAKGGAPTIVFMNHTSFIDSLIASACLAEAHCGEFRFLMTASLFKIPLWGEMSRLLGHFPVFAFANKAGSIADPLGNVSNHDDFRIDREKQQKVTRLIDDYLKKGGGLLIYPEGTISKQVRRGERITSLATFRYGGFALGSQHKTRAVALVARSCEVVWPWKAPVGGLPGEIALVAIPLEPLGKDGESHVEASKRIHSIMEREAVWLNRADPKNSMGKSPHPAIHILLGSALLICWGFILLPLLAAGGAALGAIGSCHLMILPLRLLFGGPQEEKTLDPKLKETKQS